MKRLTTLLLAAGLICSAFSAANAADIKAKGMWDFSFEYTNDSFDKHNSSDRFGAAQRLRTQIDVIASESLKCGASLSTGFYASRLGPCQGRRFPRHGRQDR